MPPCSFEVDLQPPFPTILFAIVRIIRVDRRSKDESPRVPGDVLIMQDMSDQGREMWQMIRGRLEP